MKTTLEISDNLLRRAKKVAHEQNLTLRSIVEEGLEATLEKRGQQSNDRIHPIITGGKGLRKEFQGKSWESLRNAAYGIEETTNA